MMGLWSWLLRILSELPPEKRGKRKRKDRYIPGGLDRYGPSSMKQPFSRFRRAFGKHDQDEDKER